MKDFPRDVEGILTEYQKLLSAETLPEGINITIDDGYPPLMTVRINKDEAHQNYGGNHFGSCLLVASYPNWIERMFPSVEIFHKTITIGISDCDPETGDYYRLELKVNNRKLMNLLTDVGHLVQDAIRNNNESIGEE